MRSPETPGNAFLPSKSSFYLIVVIDIGSSVPGEREPDERVYPGTITKEVGTPHLVFSVVLLNSVIAIPRLFEPVRASL